MPRKVRKPSSADGSDKPAPRKAAVRRCNSLDGKRWLQNSISVWGDIRKSPEELRLKHPAMFPAALAARLIESFLPSGSQTVLDPFAGIGSTLVAAAQLGKQAIGLELSPAFVALAINRPDGPCAAGRSGGQDVPARKVKQARLRFETPENIGGPAPSATPGLGIIHNASATDLLQYVAENSIDLCVTSPP
jgi:DNA modification methylase